MRLFCYFGRHLRLKNRVRHDGHDYVSVCGRCGSRMRKHQDGFWRIDREE